MQLSPSYVAPQLLLTFSGIDADNLDLTHDMSQWCRNQGFYPGFLLKVQDYKQENSSEKWLLREETTVQDYYHQMSSAGHELLMSGLGRLDPSSSAAEFHGLGKHETKLRLLAAQRQLGALGFEPSIFAPSQWQIGEEGIKAARELGYRATLTTYGIVNHEEDYHYDVRVLALGEGFGSARWWRRSLASSVARAVKNGKDVRLSLDIRKLSSDRRKDDIRTLIQDLARAGYQGANYESYLFE